MQNQSSPFTLHLSPFTLRPVGLSYSKFPLTSHPKSFCLWCSFSAPSGTIFPFAILILGFIPWSWVYGRSDSDHIDSRRVCCSLTQESHFNQSGGQFRACERSEQCEKGGKCEKGECENSLKSAKIVKSVEGEKKLFVEGVNGRAEAEPVDLWV